jgi:hypothetical protein
MAWGHWWALQWGRDRLGVGVHVELRRRTGSDAEPYGPYVDLHLPGFVFSIGRNPIYAGELDLIRSFSRGGLRG